MSETKQEIPGTSRTNMRVRDSQAPKVSKKKSVKLIAPKQSSLQDVMSPAEASKQAEQEKKDAQERKFVQMIMRQQTKLQREKLKEEQLKLQAEQELLFQKEVLDEKQLPQVETDTGAIDYKIDFLEGISGDENSWNDGFSSGSNGEDDDEPQEEYYDQEELDKQEEEELDDGIVYNIQGEIVSLPTEIGEDTPTAALNSESATQDGTPTEKIVDTAEQQVAPVVSSNLAEKSDESNAEEDKGPKRRMIINVAQTRYEVISKVARKVCNWRMRNYLEDEDGAVKRGDTDKKLSPKFDLTWHDTGISADFFQRLHPYQKVNMYPGIKCITKKHNLARNLMRMYKAFPKDYDFFPKTWVLPNEFLDLRNHFAHNANNSNSNKITYIVKPDSLCQGKGIFLSRSVDQICEITSNQKVNPNLDYPDTSEKVGYVVQQYIDRPHLIDDLKYDLRLYVFLYGVSPLRIYLHQMAFARFCTEAYEKPNRRNMDNAYMHLTNYAINKNSDKYQDGGGEDEADDDGHKRSLGAILAILKREGCDVDKFMEQIKEIIVKTVITAQPNLSHMYRSCQPECLDNSMAFQILGFDVLIDAKFKPWLLEVNCSPSFGTDSKLDYKIKKNVIADAFQMLNFSDTRRQEFIQQRKERQEIRQKTGKTNRLTQQQREKIRIQKLAERFKLEGSQMRGYELIFPCVDKAKRQMYEVQLKKSNEIYDDFFQGKNRGKKVSNDSLASKVQVTTLFKQTLQKDKWQSAVNQGDKSPAVAQKPATQTTQQQIPQTKNIAQTPSIQHLVGSSSRQHPTLVLDKPLLNFTAAVNETMHKADSSQRIVNSQQSHISAPQKQQPPLVIPYTHTLVELGVTTQSPRPPPPKSVKPSAPVIPPQFRPMMIQTLQIQLNTYQQTPTLQQQSQPANVLQILQSEQQNVPKLAPHASTHPSVQQLIPITTYLLDCRDSQTLSKIRKTQLNSKQNLSQSAQKVTLQSHQPQPLTLHPPSHTQHQPKRKLIKPKTIGATPQTVSNARLLSPATNAAAASPPLVTENGVQHLVFPQPNLAAITSPQYCQTEQTERSESQQWSPIQPQPQHLRHVRNGEGTIGLILRNTEGVLYQRPFENRDAASFGTLGHHQQPQQTTTQKHSQMIAQINHMYNNKAITNFFDQYSNLIQNRGNTTVNVQQDQNHLTKQPKVSVADILGEKSYYTQAGQGQQEQLSDYKMQFRPSLATTPHNMKNRAVARPDDQYCGSSKLPGLVKPQTQSNRLQRNSLAAVMTKASPLEQHNQTPTFQIAGGNAPLTPFLQQELTLKQQQDAKNKLINSQFKPVGPSSHESNLLLFKSQTNTQNLQEALNQATRNHRVGGKQQLQSTKLVPPSEYLHSQELTLQFQKQQAHKAHFQQIQNQKRVQLPNSPKIVPVVLGSQYVVKGDQDLHTQESLNSVRQVGQLTGPISPVYIERYRHDSPVVPKRISRTEDNNFKRDRSQVMKVNVD